MQKFLVVMFVVLFVSGCAQTTIDSSLSEVDSVSLKDIGYGHSAIDSYTVTRSGHYSADNIKICLANSISNSGVTLTDSANSYVGAYSGHYYQRTTTTSVQGSNTVIAETKDKIVATGMGNYYTGGLLSILRYVRYIVTVSSTENSTKYVFTQIEQAAQNTGALANNGFGAAGAWSGADPMKVINTLDGEVDKITKCLAN